MTDYLFVSPGFEFGAFQEIVGVASFEAAEHHAEQLAEELQQRVQFWELAGEAFPAIHYTFSNRENGQNEN